MISPNEPLPASGNNKTTGTGSGARASNNTNENDESNYSREHQRYKELFDHSLNGIAIHEIVLDDDRKPIDYIFLDANPAFEALTGLVVKDILGKRVTEVIPGIEKSSFIEVYGKVALTGESIHIEEYAAPLEKYFDITAFSPKKGQFVAIFSDITEQKKAVAEIQKSEDQYRRLFEQSNDAVFIHSTDGSLIDVNIRACEMLGYSKEQLITLNLLDLHPNQEKEETSRGLRAIDTASSVRIESKLIKSNGTIIDVDISSNIIDPEKGVIQGIVRDITERKIADELIRKEKEFTDNILECINDTFYLFDPETGEGLLWNKALEEMSGYDYNVVRHYPPTHFYPPEEHHLINGVMKSLEETGRANVSLSYITKDGTRIPYEYSAARISHPDGRNLVSVIGRDITERKNTEENVRRLNQFLDSLIDNADVWLNVLDENANVVIWNKAAERISGYKKEEVIGHAKIWEWAYPDEKYREEITTQAAAIIEKNRVLEDFVTTIQCKNGKTRIISWNSRNLTDEHGNPIGSIALGRDITEHKKAEDALRESERKLATIIDHSTDVFYIQDTENNLTYVSPQCERVFGYTPEEMKVNWTTLITDNPMNEEGIKLTEKAIETGERQRAYILESKHKDKHSVFIEINESPIKDEFGNVIGITGASHDITEELQAQEAFKKSEERYRILYENTPVMLHSIDGSGNIISVSHHWLKNLGFERDEVIGRKSTEFLTEASRKFAQEVVLPDFFKKGYCKDIPYQFVKKNGEIIDVLLSAISEKDESGNVVHSYAALIDITERKKAENALRDTLAFNKTILDSSPDLIYIYDLQEGRNIYSNEGITNILGYSVPEIQDYGETLLPKLMHPDDFQRYLKEIIPQYELAKDGDIIEHDYRIKHKDGDWRWLHSKELIFTRDDTGKPKQIFGIINDISARKDAMQVIEMLAKFPSENPNPVLRISSDGRILYGNTSSDFLLKYLKTEVGEFLPDSWKMIVERIFVDNKPEVIEQEVGEVVLSLNFAPIQEFDYINVYGLDITDRINAQRKIEHLSRFPSENPNPVLRIDKDGTIIYSNDSSSPLLELWDCKEGECLSPEWHVFAVDALESGVPQWTEAICGDRTFALTYAPVSEEDYINVYALDITDRKKLEHELREYSVHLEDMVEERTQDLRETQDQLVKKEKLAILGQLAGGISHELRNPLGAIKNSAYFLNIILKDKSEDVKSSLDIIDNEVTASTKIIESLLDFARPSKSIRQEIDIHAILDSVLERLSSPSNITVHRTYPDRPLLIHGDPSKFKQAIENIVINGYQAMPQGGTLSISSSIVEGKEGSGEVKILISDTGIGMTHNVLAHLFEPLFTTKAKGIGLGLSLTKTLLEMNQGSIDVESEEGKGSTFIITIPTNGGKSVPKE